MDLRDAEEFTESLGQIAGGGWRMAALGERMGVPEALGLTTREWIQERLGGYIKMSVTHRREAVGELAEEGMSTRKIGDVLGVDHSTVVRDGGANAPSGEPEPDPRDDSGANAPPKPKTPSGPKSADPLPEQVCPTCCGTGWVPVAKETT